MIICDIVAFLINCIIVHFLFGTQCRIFILFKEYYHVK